MKKTILVVSDETKVLLFVRGQLVGLLPLHRSGVFRERYRPRLSKFGWLAAVIIASHRKTLEDIGAKSVNHVGR